MTCGCRSNEPSRKLVDYRNPEDVRQLIDRIIQKPRRKPKSVVHSYSSGIGHVDGYIPSNWVMEWNFDENKHYYRYTYHDGRLVTCTFLRDPEHVTDSIWYNESGAPILNRRFSHGARPSYMLASFDHAGRIKKIYHYGPYFDLFSYREFTYQGGSTRITYFDRNSEPTVETLFENGEVFRIRNGKKKKVNNGTRENLICRPVKFGLKPIYPAY